jgi:hypothetical protein
MTTTTLAGPGLELNTPFARDSRGGVACRGQYLGPIPGTGGYPPGAAPTMEVAFESFEIDSSTPGELAQRLEVVFGKSCTCDAK